MPQKIILDVDTGTDDALALMLAALHPDLDLVAATTVNGNVPVKYCTNNTLRVFDAIGVRVPVYEGLSSPFVRPDFPRKPGLEGKHSENVHGLELEIPAPTSTAQSQNAVDFLIEYYMGPDGPDTILCPVGPLSNVAMALRMEPRLAERIPEMVIMGGGHVVGNVTPSAEFNIWADPEGARVAMAAGIPMTLVPLDATHKALLNQDHLATLKTFGTPAADAAVIFTEHLGRWHKNQTMVPFGSVPMHDSLVVCAVIDRTVIETVHVFVDIETFGELTIGRTVCDTHSRSGKEPNCHVALGVDQNKYIDIIMS
ncbi:MAG: nucleoside hydrolase, partial [Anaerolineae bacterium]|nr:nucleoside hydrolase [Anaerolineae bacterium]